MITDGSSEWQFILAILYYVDVILKIMKSCAHMKHTIIKLQEN